MAWKDQEILDALKESFDLEDQYKVEREQLNTKKYKDKLDTQRMKQIEHSLDQINAARTDVIANNPGLWEAYAAKYRTVPEPAKPAEPETESVWKHPSNLLAHGWLGAKEFVGLPFRAVESLTGKPKEGQTGGGGYWPEPYSFKSALEKHRTALSEADRAKNIDPSATGTQVAEALGGAAIPVGPSLQSGRTLANILKGAGWATGAYAAERVARDEPWSAEGLATTAAAGGAMGGVLGKLFGRKAPTTGAGVAGGPAPSTTPPPRPTAPTTPAGDLVDDIARTATKEVSGQLELPTAGKEVPRATKGLRGILRPKEAPMAEAPVATPAAEALSPMAEARAGIKAEKVAQKTAGKGKTLTPSEALDVAKQMDVEAATAAKEATLGKVISGEVDVNKLPTKRGAAKLPKSEALAPAVEGEAGASPAAVGKIAESKPAKVQQIYDDLIAKGKTPQQAKELAEFKADARLPVKPEAEPKGVRLEDFIKEKGYGVRTREPFPGVKEFDIFDPKSGNIIARGDREQLVNAIGNRPEAKGLKLYSFPAGIEDFGTYFKDALRKAGAKVPEGVEVENMPHKAGAINTLLRPFETPEFNLRKTEAGTAITDAGRTADRQISTRVRDLINEEIIPGQEYRPTKLSQYFSLPADVREKVNKVLVLGDKSEITYTPEQLARHGLSVEEITAYQGVREALDKVVNWVKEIGPEYAEFDARKIEGYIPRVWKGDWEIFVDGAKHLKAKTQTSSFATMTDAASEAYKIKAASPDAKISIKFFPDPEYLSSRGLLDARVVARLKGNLERMGYTDSSVVDEAFKMGKSVKGFAKHLLERKDATGYETQDLDKVLNSYFYQAARRIEMSKVKSVAEEILKNNKADLAAGQVKYIQEYVERIAGKPAWDQIAIHNFIQDTPLGKWIDPVRGGKAITAVKDLTTHLTLGFGNVGWALINLDGVTRHVWPMMAKEAKMLGMTDVMAAEHYLGIGIQKFFSDKGLKEMLAHHGVIDIQLMSEQLPRIGHEFGKGRWTPERVSLLLGTLTEEFSRGVAAIGRYQMSLDSGANQEQAMAAAAKFVEQTLGRYSRGGRPPAFTGAIGSTVGLFKTYMAVMLQNGWRAFESKDIGTITRYVMGAVGVSGLLGLVPGIEDLDDAVTKSTGWSPIETLEKNLPESVVSGLGTLAGVDLSRRAGVPEIFPNDLRSWSGPVIGRYSQVIADALNGELGEAAIDLMPTSVRNIIQVVRGAKEGKIIGRLDKPTFETTPAEAALHAVGLPPKREVAESREYRQLENKRQYRESALDRLTRKIVKDQASDADWDKFRELGGTSRRIREEQRRETSTMKERQLRHLPKILRREAYE